MRRVTQNRAPSREWIAPRQIHYAFVDPSTGLLLVRGCRPEHGRAMREVFIGGREPASACPSGSPEPEPPGVLAGLITWGEFQLQRGHAWVASYFGGDKRASERKGRDHQRGTPNLPAQTEAPPMDPQIGSHQVFEEGAAAPGSAGATSAGSISQPDGDDKPLSGSGSSVLPEPAAVGERGVLIERGSESTHGANADR